MRFIFWLIQKLFIEKMYSLVKFFCFVLHKGYFKKYIHFYIEGYARKPFIKNKKLFMVRIIQFKTDDKCIVEYVS